MKGRPSEYGSMALAFILPLLVSALSAPATSATKAERAEYKKAPGPYRVEAVRYDWQDKARNRPVPVKIYCPATGDGPFPVIIFSHGAGGSREGYEYLGRQWASYGYVSVHVQHKGSDEEIWRGTSGPLAALRKAVADPRNAVERPRDVSFAIDRVEEMNRTESPFRGRLDLTRVGVAGHSFGAWTTLAVVGETFILPGGRQLTFTDPRVRAAISMSAPAPRGRNTPASAFGGIRVPCLHMTGTLDDSPMGDTKAPERRIPYDNINGADQYLVTFVDGDHMIFSGRGRLPVGAKDALFQDLIRMGTTAFWDAYLLDDPGAKAWLADGGYAAALDKNGRLEAKLKQSAASGPPAGRP